MRNSVTRKGGLGGGRKRAPQIFLDKGWSAMGLSTLPLVICNRSDLCGEIDCTWNKPSNNSEIGGAYCELWDRQTNSGRNTMNIVIMRMSEFLRGKKATRDPNLAFARRKHGL